MTDRQLRIDGLPEKIRIAGGATKVIEPPAHIVMEERALVYFHEMIAEKAKADWSEHEISLCALLARSIAELDYNQERMQKEGSMVKNKSGDIVANPRQKIITNLYDKIATMRRSIGIYSMAAGGKKFDVLKRQMLAREMEKDFMSIDDDLMARPN